MILTPQQEEAMHAMRHFLNDDASQVFILKGYAGTGKTTLIGILTTEITKLNRTFQLMAPTGRAAKVLRSKLPANETTTIHKRIYQYAGVVVNEDAGVLRYIYPLRPQVEKNICIIDEASMVSSRKANSELFQFGTGVLIEDLLAYSGINLGQKIIFVGDPMQLPPVGDNRSAALDENYFIEKGLNVSSYELTDVVRQDKESAILNNATMLRELFKSGKRNQLVFDRKEREVMDLTSLEVANHYSKAQYRQTAVICYSNKQAAYYNREIRKILFPSATHVAVGDQLMVVTNNYYGEEMLLNGDIITVTNLEEETKTLSAPVISDVAGKKRRIVVPLTFRKITFQTEAGKSFTRYIIETLLENINAALSIDEIKSLYINAVMRLNEKGLTNTKSENFRNALFDDPFFNALQVKYGYAFTCHKAQGGEWDRTYVDFTQRTGLDPDALRWKYTAITRARKELYCINLPNVTPLSKLKINPIIKISKINSEAVSLAPVPETPFHAANASTALKAKYWAVTYALEGTPYIIKTITSKPYREMYELDTPSGIARMDCIYNGAGIFTSYTLKGEDEERNNLLPIFESQGEQYQYQYTPRIEVLQVLHHYMLSLCDEIEITITNVIENTQGYNVTYYLIGSGRFAVIVFYYDKRGFISYAAPASDCGGDDLKMAQLIERLC